MNPEHAYNAHSEFILQYQLEPLSAFSSPNFSFLRRRRICFLNIADCENYSNEQHLVPHSRFRAVAGQANIRVGGWGFIRRRLVP